MARHNRIARGSDQCQQEYELRFQPDWLRRFRVTRRLKSGRQSTMNVFRNPTQFRRRDPGSTVRTDVKSADGAVDFAVVLHDPRGCIRQVTVTVDVAGPERPPVRRKARQDQIQFTFDGDLKSVPDR